MKINKLKWNEKKVNCARTHVRINTYRMVMLEEGVHALHLLRGEGLQDEQPVVTLVELGAGLARRLVRDRLGPADKTVLL